MSRHGTAPVAFARALALAGVFAFAATAAAEAPRRRPTATGTVVTTAPVWYPPSSPLPSLPVIAAVRVDVARDHVVVTEDILLARGDFHGGDLAFFVAFGAPGAPRAFDARLLAADPARIAAVDETASEPVAVERAPRRPKTALLLLGRPQMAGAVVHVREPAFRRAVSAAGAAMVRLRTLLEIPQEDARGGRELVVRLGSEDGAPLAVARLELHGDSARTPVVAAGAHLCGDGADPYPLAVVVTPPPPAPRPPVPRAEPLANVVAPAPLRPTAPWLVVRRATDDLCVRFYTDAP